MKNNNTAEASYTRLEATRFPYLKRARAASAVTIPTLIPAEGSSGSSEFPTPYQSVGARGVNNLASALLLSLLPPNSPFFRLVIDEAALSKVAESAGGEALTTQIEASLSKVERSVMREVETTAIRVHVYEALRHLIVGGNILLNMLDSGELRVIHLDRFVVERDPMGEVQTIIIKETVNAEALPDEAKALVATADKAPKDGKVDMYTCIKVVKKKVHVYQEIGGAIVPKSSGSYKKDKSPYLALRMNRTDGEDYGRGYVEQYMGDLLSLESLMMSIVQGSAAAAKILFMVAPNGVTRARVLAEAPNGAIVEGSAGDVTVLQLNKAADFGIAYQTVQTLSDRLSYAFLLTDNAIRKAERVTAAEVRLVTQSIERQLGGIYSVLSQELQLPLVKRIMFRMEKAKRLPKLPTDLVTPTIITGIEALGRGNDLNKMDEFLGGVAQLLGPEALGQYVNMREYMDRRALALGIETDGLIRSEEEIQQEKQQAMMMQAAQQFGPQAMDMANQQQMAQAEQGQAPPPSET
jgi:hypothetical protein